MPRPKQPRSPAAAPRVDVRQAAGRFLTTSAGVESRHSFSFGPHYDPANTHPGVLVAHADVLMPAGTGFDTHPHREMEILTWVLDGSLLHEDSTGRRGVLERGVVQRMSAGTGVIHSEKNHPHLEPGRAPGAVHLVQMWVAPDEAGGEPAYEQCDVRGALASGALVTVASGVPEHRAPGVIGLGNRGAALHVAELAGGATVELPDAAYLHLYVARGSVVLGAAGPLRVGDAVRFSEARGQRVSAEESSEILVWEMYAELRPAASR